MNNASNPPLLNWIISKLDKPTDSNNIYRGSAAIQQENEQFLKGFKRFSIGFVLLAGGGLLTISQINYSNSPQAKIDNQRRECIGQLMDSLRDPGSLKIDSITNNGNRIAYRARNGFGGYVRDTFYC